MPLNHNDHFVVNAAQPSRRHVIEFKLSEEVLEEILNGNESLQLDMNQAKLLIGSTAFDFTHMGGISNMELYKLSPGAKQLDLVGDIKAKCTIQRTLAKKGAKKATKHEPVRTTQILDPNDLKKRTKTTQPPARRAPSPLPSVATSANAGAVVPLKTRVIQLLALQPLGLSELQGKVGSGDLQAIMPMVATLSGGKYILKAEAYRDVKIFDWKNYSAKQREVVVKNASAAFDKLGLGPDSIERSKLSPEKVRHSPPLVAEGYHVAGTMDASSKWRPNGGGSESEGLENGKAGLLKPSSARKKVTTKKSPATPSLSSKKKVSSSTKPTSKSAVRSLDIATILDQVPNHSAKVATGTHKPPGSVHAGSPGATGRRPSVTTPNGNGVTAVIPKKGSETKKTSGGNKDSSGASRYKIPKVGSGTTLPRKPPSPAFVVPPIRTQAEYEEISRQFMDKYQEMKKLKTVIDEKKLLLEELKIQLEKAIGTDREQALKRKVQEAFGEDIVDRKVLRMNGEPRSGVSSEKAAAAKLDKVGHMSIKTMAERYKALHAEAEMIKSALVEASTAAQAAADRNGTSGGNG
ncbi:hypothetical protein MVEG_04829 [Podila verticillata NRRL 6337]|nr:hypothetical protein MVEG_04829 [Podila verticillata NRRL 6337]